MRAIAERLTYANVVATVALVIAVGAGSAYAANTVFSTDIVDGEVKAVDIASEAVRSVDVLDQALTGADVAQNSLKGADIDEATLNVGARAYAIVRATACTGTPLTCPHEQSKGISRVTREATGVYCVAAPGINAEVTPAAVTVEASITSDAGNTSAMTSEFGITGCGPAGRGFFVYTQRQPHVAVNQGSGTNNADAVGFTPLAANNVSFTIVIP